VMVSGNAMTHLYVDLEETTRRWWPALADKWNGLVERLLERESVDLLILPTGPGSCEERARGRGAAKLEWREARYSCQPLTGDPLGVGEQVSLTDVEAYEATIESDYP